jgi:hypothetical protein
VNRLGIVIGHRLVWQVASKESLAEIERFKHSIGKTASADELISQSQLDNQRLNCFRVLQGIGRRFQPQ